MENDFVFIISSYNNEKWVNKNLDSVIKQNYKKWRIIYVDDCSTDNTFDLVENYVKDNKLETKITLIRNKENMKQSYSRYIAFRQCQDNEICCLLDGDDWLYDNNVLDKLNNFYKENNVEVSYGNYCVYDNNTTKTGTIQPDIPSNIIKSKLYRHFFWRTVHMRTGLAKHFKSYPIEYIKDHENNFFHSNTDVNEMMWVLEKCNGKHKNHGFFTYCYNLEASKEYPNSFFNFKNYNMRIYQQEALNFIRLNRLNRYELKKSILIFSQLDFSNLDFFNFCESINLKYKIFWKKEK